MKDIIRFGLILMIVSVVAASALAAVYAVTNPRIQAQKQAQLQAALTAALPGSTSEGMRPVSEGGEVLYYQARDSQDSTRLLGYAVIARGVGYSSTIESIIGVDSSGTIIGMKVLSQAETPGLGTKVQEIKYGEKDPWFSRQFIGRSASQVAVDKDGGEIKAITGATISSRAVARSINAAYGELAKRIGQQTAQEK